MFPNKKDLEKYTKHFLIKLSNNLIPKNTIEKVIVK